MRTASRWVLVAVAACAVAGAASAQENRRPGQRRPGGGEGGQPPGGFGGGMMMSRGGGAAMLLANEGVQKELKLTDEQKTKVKDFADAQRTKMREMFTGGGQPDREKMQEAMKEMTEKSDKFVKETLKDDQMKRLKQIQYQQMGFMAFANEDVQKALKLTDEQKDKLKGLGEEMRKDSGELARDLRGGGDAAAEARKKMQAVTKEYQAKAQETLTDEQKSAWKELTGAPFEVKMEGRPGGDRRPGGEGGTTPGRRPGGNRPPRSENPPPA